MTDDLLELLEAELEGLDEQALDREFAELVERLAAEPPELRARRGRRPQTHRRRPIELVCIVMLDERELDYGALLHETADARQGAAPLRPKL